MLTNNCIYNAFCNIKVNHLSSYYDKTILSLYVSDEEEYFRRFKNEFYFFTEHYCKSNINVVELFSQKTVAMASSDEAKIIIAEIFKRPIVLNWYRGLPNPGRNERIVQKYIEKRQYDKIFHLFQPNILRRVKRKIM